MADGTDVGSVREVAIRGDNGQVVAKALFLNRDRIADPQAKPPEELQPQFSTLDILEPPCNPTLLVFFFRNSASLRKCIDAMVANVESPGFVLEPTIDLADDDALAEALWLEDKRVAEAKAPAAGPRPRIAWPDSERVAERREALRLLMREERAETMAFFERCTQQGGLRGLRRKTRTDMETFGWGDWEVLRNRDGRGEVSEFSHIRSFSIRMLPLDAQVVEVNHRQRTSPLGSEVVKAGRRFHRFVQIMPGTIGKPSYFREYGDPRTISAQDGRCYHSEHNPDKPPLPDGHTLANEVLHWSLYDPISPYGMPRWFGALLQIATSREATERDYAVLLNGGLPDVIVIAEGAAIPESFSKEIASWFQSNTRGTQNAGRVACLSLPASEIPGMPPPKAHIETPAKAALSAGDLLKLQAAYDNTAREQFRLGPTLAGQQVGSNRATADAEQEVAETQVFQPERDDVDEMINRILLDMGVRFWRFRSLAPKTKRPLDVSKIVHELIDGLSINDLRRLGSELLGVKLEPIPEEWARVPLAKLKTADPSAADAGPEQKAAELIATRDAFRRAAQDAEAARFTAGDDDASERLTGSEMDDLLGPSAVQAPAP